MPKMFGCLNLSHYGLWKSLAFAHALKHKHFAISSGLECYSMFPEDIPPTLSCLFVLEDLSCSDMTNNKSGQDVRVGCSLSFFFFPPGLS